MSTEKPILYSFALSSCSWRVRNALAMKNIDYEYRFINTKTKEHKNEEYLAVNPMGQVPALIIDGNVLNQSICMLEYLEEVYPEVPLLPKSPLQRAKVREICQIITSGIQPIQIVPVDDESRARKSHPNAENCMQYGFAALERILVNCSGKYCVGDTVTLADCCLVPQAYNAIKFEADISAFKIIKRIVDNLMELDAFKKAHPSNQPDYIPVRA